MMINRGDLVVARSGEIVELELDLGFNCTTREVMRLANCAAHFTAKPAIQVFCWEGTDRWPLLIHAMDDFDSKGFRYCQLIRYADMQDVVEWLARNGHAVDLTNALPYVGVGASE